MTAPPAVPIGMGLALEFDKSETQGVMESVEPLSTFHGTVEEER
jgi:hypothetical protein